MSSRDQMRRELKDLAKLASALPRDHESPTSAVGADRASGSRVTVPPSVATVPPPRARRPLPRVTPPPPRARPGNAREVVIPPAPAVPFLTYMFPKKASSEAGGGWAAIVLSTLAVAMIGGLALGQVLTSRGTTKVESAATKSSTAAPPNARESTGSADGETAARSGLSPMGAFAATPMPPPIPTAIMITGACPPASVAVRAPRPTHHTVPLQAQVARPSSPASPPPSTSAPAQGASAVRGNTTPKGRSGRDALEDLIRRVASGS
jgi:hypothetical protein